MLGRRERMEGWREGTPSALHICLDFLRQTPTPLTFYICTVCPCIGWRQDSTHQNKCLYSNTIKKPDKDECQRILWQLRSIICSCLLFRQHTSLSPLPETIGQIVICPQDVDGKSYTLNKSGGNNLARRLASECSTLKDELGPSSAVTTSGCWGTFGHVSLCIFTGFV